MKDLYLIRHGRQSSKLCNVDVCLDPYGIQQAELLAARLSGYGIERLYCSGLKRAVQTAQILKMHLGLELEVMEAFREIDFGDLTGKEDEEIRSTYGAFYRERMEMSSDLRYPGGENGGDVLRRVQPCLAQLCQRPEKRVAVVTHGGVIRTLCAWIVHSELKNKLCFSVDLENTGITHIRYDEAGQKWYLERLNDFAHLEGHPELMRSGWK